MSAPLLRVRDLCKVYPLGGAAGGVVRALDGVSIELAAGEMLALVGESGSGKSTLLAQVAGLEEPESGTIEIDGRALASLSGHQRRALRRELQLVFQDPYESLDPRQTIGQIVEEPLDVHRLHRDPDARRARVATALCEVGLEPPQAFLDRRPAELSGGQRQRVAIASALAVEPRLLLADEPVSMLDVSVRAEILNLLGRLRRDRGIGVLMVTHDLATAAAVADRIAVMYLGRIVETGPAREVLAAPRHPYSEALRAASPVADPRRRSTRAPLAGETPNAAALPTGCRFHPRCARAAARCQVEEPALLPLAIEHGRDRASACHFAAQIGDPPAPTAGR